MIFANGTESVTTFYSDFTIADRFGVSAIKDTFKRAYAEWKDNYIYLTELCVIMNIKCWEWYEKGDNRISKLYADYYYKTRSYALNHLKGEEFEHFYRMTD